MMDDDVHTINNGDGPRRRTKRPSNTGTKRLSTTAAPLPISIRAISSIFVLLALCWVSVAVYFYTQNSMVMDSNSHHSIASQNGLSQPAVRKTQPPSKSVSNGNVFDGWQPAEYVDKNVDACSSWRKCFTDNHSCPGLCRDSKSDLVEADDSETKHLLDAFDDTNWVPDVEMLHRMLLDGKDRHGRPFPPPLVTASNRQLCEHIGTSGGQGDENIVLFDAVPIEAQPLVLTDEQHQEALQRSKTDGGSRLPRILCMVYTMEAEHSTRIRAIRETWAPGCDGFLAFSTKSDPRIPAISLPHEGPEAYENMWQVSPLSV